MEELMTGKGEPSGGGGIGGGGAEGVRGGPGEEGGIPWERGFGEELSGLRESETWVHTRQTHGQERQEEKVSLLIIQMDTLILPDPPQPTAPDQKYQVVKPQFHS